MRINKMGLTVTAALLLASVGILPEEAPAAAAVQATYYASPTGSGTACSVSAPCSLTGVRDKVRTVNPSMTGDIVVMLRGGLYTLTDSLVLDYRDSGMNGHRVVWKNYTGETPVISGGQSLTGGWTLHDSIAGIYKKTGVTSRFRQLYVGETAAVRARTPNLTDANSLGAYYDAISADVTTRQYKINKAEISSWNHLNQVEMVLQPHWYHNRLRIASFTTDASYAYVSFLSPEQSSAFTKSVPFYTSNAYHFENAYEMLDSPGEWYLDRSANILYYKPRSGENMASATVTAPVVDVLLQLNGTAANPIHHLEFSGLTFRHSGWDGPSSSGLVATQAVSPITSLTVPGSVQATYGYQLRFTSNTFRQLGATGLKLGNGIKMSQIVSNTFEAIAANGIELRSPKTASITDLTSQVLIGNNTVSRVGQQYTNGIGIVGYFVQSVVIEHNEISYSPYMGIQLGGQAGCNCEAGMRKNRIRANRIHHVMQLHDDGGAIYTLGRQPGTIVDRNYIHDLSKSAYAMGYPVAGLYLDNYSEYIRVQNNVQSSIDTASGAALTYEQTGVGAMNNLWSGNETQDPAVKGEAGVSSAYTESPIVLLEEDFDGGTAGTIPAGWTVTTGSGSVQTANMPSTTDKSVLLSKSVSATTTNAQITWAPSAGIVSLQLRVRPEQTGGWKMAPYILDGSGTPAISVAFDSGSIKAYNGTTLTTLQSFTAGTWYELLLVMNTDTDKFDLYVDGIRRLANADFRSAAANLGGVRLGIGDGHTGSFYFDQLKVEAP
ncbi:right-handed parallel beta-helix repeat-containing protein [Paenibacillus sp. GD4]|uniref:right-handed parallel beta-helix repeat-containing protein n=1 Tax=Paenibacillus sp. GD4 TaxID=3068890 RepID=UPI002796B07E|nr:right-handed parallel beta-helix repeat-containing protein [Paenibacillus sp. GD4]MDQ1913672.1 right-handed parallel beta-helix repeat-containing protein [Paenibacillus sp. GD4]